jgi:hypothetical protein
MMRILKANLRVVAAGEGCRRGSRGSYPLRGL